MLSYAALAFEFTTQPRWMDGHASPDEVIG